MPDLEARRPIKARQSRWAATVTQWMVRRTITPNAISVASVGFSAVTAGCFIAVRFISCLWICSGLFILAALGIQFRLLCNLFDGMVAVEGGKAGKAGEIYNDFPDRLADPLILASAGYAAIGVTWAVDLGWAAAVMALLTAYTRVLGRSVGTGMYFTGPMAKQHRMALMTLACIASAVLVHWNWHRWVIVGVLAVIVAGCVVTVMRRLHLILGDLYRK